jgi:hypothetical protein
MEGAMITSSDPTGRLVRPARGGRTSITDAHQADGSATGCSSTGIADAQALEPRAFSVYNTDINHDTVGPKLGDEKLRWEQTAIETAKQVHPDPEFDVLGHSYSLSALREHKREAFVDGARWQRSRLGSDESVERVRAYLRDTVGINVDENTPRELVKALLKES